MNTAQNSVITTVPPDAAQHVMAGRRARLAAEGDRRKATVARLAAEYAGRRSALLGATNEARLRQYRAAHRIDGEPVSGAAAEKQRATSLAFARDLGVDVAALRRLSDDFTERAAAVLDPPGRPDQAVVHPQPSSATYTSWGSWESGYDVDFWLCDGETVSSQSYFDPALNQLGGQMFLKVEDPNSYGGAYGWRENGFLVEYTPPTSGRLIISMYLKCLVDDHFISTWDEWGWSSFYGRTRELGIVETYSDWNDWSPNDEFLNTFVQGLSSTAVDGGPGIVRMYLPGQNRAWSAASSNPVPAGQPILIYVAVQERVAAKCDDVETFIGINAAWRTTQIVVNVLPG